MNNPDKYSSCSFFCQATGDNGIHITLQKRGEQSGQSENKNVLLKNSVVF